MRHGIIERFDPTIEHEPYGSDYAEMRKDPTGGFVRYEDYLHERQTVEKLRRQLAKRKRRDARKGLKEQEQDCQPLLVDTEEPTHYDAELYEWRIGASIWTGLDIAEGQIQNDKKHRFADGVHVYTSEVLRKEQHHDGLFIYTKNSVYKLVGGGV